MHHSAIPKTPKYTSQTEKTSGDKKNSNWHHEKKSKTIRM